jgi:hypothetical protein
VGNASAQTALPRFSSLAMTDFSDLVSQAEGDHPIVFALNSCDAFLRLWKTPAELTECLQAPAPETWPGLICI